MGDVESSKRKLDNETDQDGDDTSSSATVVTVNVESDIENANDNNQLHDLGLAEMGLERPPGVTQTELCSSGGNTRNGEDDVALLDCSEESLLEIPELATKSPSSSSCCPGGLPPRTIPFRSASFSQVDVTSDGKYVRNTTRSPITLKPTAFCLLNSSNNNNNYNNKGVTAVPPVPSANPTQNYYNSSTIPRHGDKSSAFPEDLIKRHQRTGSVTVDSLIPQSSFLGPESSDSEAIKETQCPGGSDSEAVKDPQCSDSGGGGSKEEECIPLENLEPLEIPSNAPTEENAKENEALINASSTAERAAALPYGQENMADSTTVAAAAAEDESVRFYLGNEDGAAGMREQEFKLVAKCEMQDGDCPNDSNLRDHLECAATTPTTDATDAVKPTDPTLTNIPSENIPTQENEAFATTTEESTAQASGNAVEPHEDSKLPPMGKTVSQAHNKNQDRVSGTLEAALLSDDEAKSQLLRQSSGQSDGSDDIPQLNILAASSHSSALDLTTSSSSPPDQHRYNRGYLNATQLFGSPPHTGGGGSGGISTVGSSTPSLATTRGSSLDSGNYKKEISRANSVNNDSSARPLPPRRYNKRPLRGPYGKMLEAEMNKLVPGRSLRDYYDSGGGGGSSSVSGSTVDFCRESKSSSPSRSLHYSSLSNVDPDSQSGGGGSGNGGGGGSAVVGAVGGTTASLMSSNPLLMASLDDLHFTTNQSKAALNPRSRKISSQLPAQTSFPGDGTPPLAFHQRTASSPSQLLYAASSSSSSGEKSGNEPETRRRLLDGSPRGHVLAEVVETEKSYVDSLRILVKKYIEPLKLLDYIDASLVDEIFFQIPKILWHHERLLDALQRRVSDDMQCVGDVLLQTFRQNSLLECYSLFVNNWKNAKASLKMAVASKPAFARFLEENARQHKGKLTLDSLLIMPIQRIPRYELLVKELLKHTDSSHEDHARLNIALESIKQFALHIDCASVDPSDNSREIEIEGWGSGLGHLIRQDMVTLCTSSNVKKERALFLFADSLVIASIKRKSTMRKPSASTSHSSGNNWEGCKFKLLMKIPLTDVHLLNEDHNDGGAVTGGGGGGCGSGERVPGTVTTTTTTITTATGNKLLTSSLSSSSSTSPAAAAAFSSVSASKGVGASGTSSSSTSSLLLNSSSVHEDTMTTTDDLKIIHKMMELAAMLKCSHAGLDEILKDLATSCLKQQQAHHHHNDNNGDAVDLEIKSGDSSSSSDSPEVLKILFGSAEKKSGWLESFQDTLNKFIRYGFGKLPQVQFVQALPIRKTRAGLQLSCAAPVCLHNKVSKTLEMSDVWVANSDGYVGQICILTLHPEPAITSCNGVCNSRITCIISVPPPPPPPPASPIHPALAPSNHHHHHHQHDEHQHPHVHSLGYESEDESHRNRQGHKSTEHWSVWLGTEDGGLHVYDCSDSVRVKKNRHKIQHSAPLHCIVYFGNRVVVSLGNGDVAVYSRNTNGKGWSIADPSWVTIGSALYPVTKMICVRSQIWCASGAQIKVYGENGGMLELLQSIHVTVEGSNVTRGISCIAASDEHIWVAVQGTSVLKCYNNSTFECLLEINVSADVAKVLAGCDDIIRQHKSACLRVTALLFAPDKTLWVGTSAGAILTVAYSNHSYRTTPLCHGHTGQVRFMTCCTSRDSCTIISGGDGYEEFRPLTPLFQSGGGSGGGGGGGSSSSTTSSFGSMMSSLMGESSVDISGREDSTNHLLIWRIPKPSDA